MALIFEQVTMPEGSMLVCILQTKTNCEYWSFKDFSSVIENTREIRILFFSFWPIWPTSFKNHLVQPFVFVCLYWSVNFSDLSCNSITPTLKVSYFWKQIFLFSFEAKTEQNYFLISALASEKSSSFWLKWEQEN